jgi:hypothetical protein
LKYWRALLWLLPLATAIPLGVFAYKLATTDFYSYSGGKELAGLVEQLGVPYTVILVAAAVGAMLASKGRPLVALVIAASVCAWQLSAFAWTWQFWDPHVRPEYLAVFAVPGAVSGVIGISGLVLLRRSNWAVLLLVAVLLVTPILSSAGGVMSYRAAAAKNCPPGPSVDLTFSGLENAHFSTSCGIPDAVPPLAKCTTYVLVTVQLFDSTSWNLGFHPYSRTVTSGEFPEWGPSLSVGSWADYGGPSHWKGSYTFDPDGRCAGTVDAYLFSAASAEGSVHVTGRFVVAG